jgi:nucleotide-binding universal stress UspA family protein
MKKNIVVPIDFTDKSYKTLQQSFHLAKIFDADITLLHVRQDTKKTYFFSLFSEEETSEMKKKYIEVLHAKLKAITSEAMQKHGIKVNAMLSKGRIFDKIVEIAETVNAEFIFIDRFTADGTPKDYIGTNASRIIRQAQCPVLINNHNYDFSKGFKNIILPLDLTEGSRQKVSKAVEFAKICNSKINVISGLLEDNKQKASQLKVLSKQVGKFLNDAGLEYSVEFITSIKKEESFPSLIFEYSKKNEGDLIVIMTQPEIGWVKSYISSNALEIIRNSESPVMSMAPKDINMVVASF